MSNTSAFVQRFEPSWVQQLMDGRSGVARKPGNFPQSINAASVKPLTSVVMLAHRDLGLRGMRTNLPPHALSHRTTAISIMVSQAFSRQQTEYSPYPCFILSAMLPAITHANYPDSVFPFS